MAVSIHDSAYELEKAIRNSDDYKNLKRLYDEVNSDAITNTLFQKFRNMQMDMQQKQMMGQEISEADIANAQIVVADVQKNEKIAQLMQAEEQMSNIITDLNQIILKPLEELYGPIGQQ